MDGDEAEGEPAPAPRREGDVDAVDLGGRPSREKDDAPGDVDALGDEGHGEGLCQGAQHEERERDAGEEEEVGEAAELERRLPVDVGAGRVLVVLHEVEQPRHPTPPPRCVWRLPQGREPEDAENGGKCSGWGRESQPLPAATPPSTTRSCGRSSASPSAAGGAGSPRGRAGACLEIGAGTGAQLRWYAPRASVTALEPDASMRERARRRAARAAANVTVVDGRAEGLPVRGRELRRCRERVRSLHGGGPGGGSRRAPPGPRTRRSASAAGARPSSLGAGAGPAEPGGSGLGGGRRRLPPRPRHGEDRGRGGVRRRGTALARGRLDRGGTPQRSLIQHLRRVSSPP